jgi:hypothetical protein
VGVGTEFEILFRTSRFQKVFCLIDFLCYHFCLSIKSPPIGRRTVAWNMFPIALFRVRRHSAAMIIIVVMAKIYIRPVQVLNFVQNTAYSELS